MIDVNVSLFGWPFRRLPSGSGPKLVSRLRSHGVTRAWAGTFEALLEQDLTAVNARLHAACKALAPDLLLPFGAVNPTCPGWQDDLRRCHEYYGMPGIRLHPGYHGYTLEEPRFGELLSLAAGKNLAVQIALSMEDERTQDPLMHAPRVDPSPLEHLLKNGLPVTIVLLNGRHDGHVSQLAAAGRVYFDLAMVEGPGGAARLATQVSAERVLFGSNFPLFYFESALGKMREAAFPQAIDRAIRETNARGLVAT